MLKDEETFQKYSDAFGPLNSLMKDSLVNANGEVYKYNVSAHIVVLIAL